MKQSNFFKQIWETWQTLPVPKRVAWLSMIVIVCIIVIRITTEGFTNFIFDSVIFNAATLTAFFLAVIALYYTTPAPAPPSTVVVPPSEPLTSSISGYDQDIFVSFAATDKDWATNLVETLRDGLKVRVSKLGHCSIWMDEAPRQALDILEHTATLLLILSPDWVKSSDCRKALQTFLQLHHDPSRVVVVTRQPVDLPVELQGCQLYRFWDNSGYKPAHIEPRFHNQTVTLATDLANKLKELRQPVAPPKTTVFLAEVTDDLEDSRRQLKNVLEQEGCRVLPQGTALFTEHPETRWQADLAQASVFIQLLSHLPGKQHLPWLQYQAAQTAKVKQILQWRDKQLNLDQVTHSQHKTLLESNTVMAIGIEEFRQEVLRVIKPRVETPTDPGLLTFPIFVNACPEDENFGKQILGLLSKYGIHGIGPLYKNKAVNGKDVKKKMSFCRAMVLVYGQAGFDWVDAQHSDFNQICRNSGRDCLPPLAFCHLPEKQDFPGGDVIPRFSCTGNLEQDLSRFLTQYQLKPHA